MNYIFENPLPILFAGSLFFAVFYAAWTQQRKRQWMLAMFGTLLLVIGGVVLEQIIVTDAEDVASTIHQIANDMESNDVAALVSHISPTAEELRSHAESILNRVTVENVSVKRNLNVVVSESGTRKTAIAKFNAVARLEDKTGTFGNQAVPRFMILDLVMEDGTWRIVRYEAKMPQEGMGQ